jgi:acetoin utilization protein AcuB
MTGYTAKKIMSTRLITAEPEQSILEAYLLMSHHSIRQLPVCKNKKIVGIITDRDIREAVGKKIKEIKEEEIKDLNLDKKPISDFMTYNPTTITPDTLIEKAVQIINAKKIGSLPVCKDDKTLVGIVTVTDISGLLLKLLQEKAKSTSL